MFLLVQINIIKYGSLPIYDIYINSRERENPVFSRGLMDFVKGKIS